MASSGNFCTFNSISKVGSITFSGGNTKSVHANNQASTIHDSTFDIPKTGKWYFECRFANNNTGGGLVSMFVLYDRATEYIGEGTFTNQGGNYITYYGYQNGIYIGSSLTNYTSNIGTQAGAIVGCAIDRDNNHMWVSVNNTWINGTPDFSDGTNKVASPTAGADYGLAFSGAGGSSSAFWICNFGQASDFLGTETAQGNADANGFGDFYYAPPSGYLGICSGNLPISADIDPAQTDNDIPQKQFNVLTYNASGGDSYTGLGFKPDLVWVKWRGGSQSHGIFDSSRGTSKVLNCDTQTAEATSSGLTSFDSDGYTMGNSYNQSGREYVGWCWRANGGVTSSNSDGATASVVQANTKSGFSIVTYTGFSGASGTSTVGHSLQKAPEFIITKSRNSDSRWWVQHVGLSAVTKTILLNSSAAEGDYSSYGTLSAPTSSVFSINGVEGIGGSARNYIAYVWHSVEGFSKFGKFEGNSNADGPFVYTGFRPRFFWIKEIDNADDWVAYDTARNTANTGSSKVLNFDNANAEDDSSGRTVDVLSNGFKIRTSNSTINASATYIYGAWGSVPFRYNNTF